MTGAGEKRSSGIWLSGSLLMVGVSGAALAVGTVHPRVLCVVTAVLILAAVAAWSRAEAMSTRPAATMLLVTGIGLTLYSALQCAPLPQGVLAAISPHAADVWSRALSPLHEPASALAPVSVDPIATRFEVLKGVAYLLAFVTALRIARSRNGVTFLSGVVIATGVVLAVTALLHPAFGAKKLFGVYDPGFGISERHIAPLLDPNHLAAYLNLAFCLALASAVASDPPIPRAIALAIVFLLGSTQIWVASRGGVASLILGAVFVFALRRAAPSASRPRPKASEPVVAGVVILAGLGMLFLASQDNLVGELFQTDLSKLDLARQAMRVALAYPMVGSGRGSFETAYPQFLQDVGYNRFTHPENVVAQWTSEWGFPVAIAAFVAIGFALRPSTALARSHLASGAWAGLAAVAAQNLVDFSSEVPGVMLSAVVCAAIVVAGSAGRSARWKIEGWSRAPIVVAVTAALVGVLVCGWAALALDHDVKHDRDALHDAAAAVVPVDTMHAMARSAMQRHPAEPYLPFAVALRATAAADDDLIPWIGATLERARVYGPAHMVFARALQRRFPAQARLEYRLAFEQAPYLTGYAGHELPELVRSFYDAMELVPTGPAGPRVLATLVEALEARLPATRVRLDHELSSRVPTSLGPVARAARDAGDDVGLENPAPWCEGGLRAACIDQALALARQVEQLAPHKCQGFALESRVILATGDADRSIDALQRAADSVDDRTDCLQALVQLATDAHRDARALAALDAIVKAGCLDENECARRLVWVAATEQARGSSLKALATYKLAYARAPQDDSILVRMAALAAQVGLHAEALEDYERLAKRQPGQAMWPTAAQQQRDQLSRQRLRALEQPTP